MAEALKEKGLDKEFQLKAVPCSGIEACEVALLKAKRGVLDGNFYEGMACDGGCVQGGRAVWVRSPRNRMDVEGHAKQASGRQHHRRGGRPGSWIPQDAWGEGRPCAQASAKGGGGRPKQRARPGRPSSVRKPGRRTWIQVPASGSCFRAERGQEQTQKRGAAFWPRRVLAAPGVTAPRHPPGCCQCHAPRTR